MGVGVTEGIGVMKAYWNHTHKHTLSLTDKHCKQMKTAQAGLWRARGFVCLTVTPVLKEVIPGSDMRWTQRQHSLAMETVRRAECLFGSLSFVSSSRIIACQQRFILSRQRIVYRQMSAHRDTHTHAICTVTFQTVPCQQQTTAVLHIKLWLCHAEMDGEAGALSSLHLLSCFLNFLENVIMRFSISPHENLRHLLI